MPILTRAAGPSCVGAAARAPSCTRCAGPPFIPSAHRHDLRSPVSPNAQSVFLADQGERPATDFICGQEDENDRAEVVLVCEPDLHNNLMGVQDVPTLAQRL